MSEFTVPKEKIRRIPANKFDELPSRFRDNYQIGADISPKRQMAMEEFILEQIVQYLKEQKVTEKDPDSWNWVQVACNMRNYCTTNGAFHEPDLKKRYRVHNLYADNVGHFIINRYIQYNGLGFKTLINEPLHEDYMASENALTYLNEIIGKTKLKDIIELNMALYLKDDSRYPTKPLPSYLAWDALEEKWRDRLEKCGESSDGLLTKMQLHTGRRAQILAIEGFVSPPLIRGRIQHGNDLDAAQEHEKRQPESLAFHHNPKQTSNKPSSRTTTSATLQPNLVVEKNTAPSRAAKVSAAPSYPLEPASSSNKALPHPLNTPYRLKKKAKPMPQEKLTLKILLALAANTAIDPEKPSADYTTKLHSCVTSIVKGASSRRNIDSDSEDEYDEQMNEVNYGYFLEEVR